MIINKRNGNTLYIPDNKITYAEIDRGSGMVWLDIAVEGIHGLSNSWEFKTNEEEAKRVLYGIGMYQNEEMTEEA